MMPYGIGHWTGNTGTLKQGDTEGWRVVAIRGVRIVAIIGIGKLKGCVGARKVVHEVAKVGVDEETDISITKGCAAFVQEFIAIKGGIANGATGCFEGKCCRLYLYLDRGRFASGMLAGDIIHDPPKHLMPDQGGPVTAFEVIVVWLPVTVEDGCSEVPGPLTEGIGNYVVPVICFQVLTCKLKDSVVEMTVRRWIANSIKGARPKLSRDVLLPSYPCLIINQASNQEACCKQRGQATSLGGLVGDASIGPPKQGTIVEDMGPHVANIEIGISLSLFAVSG
jgi:hypothetical protein